MSEHDTKVQANHNEIEEACMKNYEDLTERVKNTTGCIL